MSVPDYIGCYETKKEALAKCDELNRELFLRSLEKQVVGSKRIKDFLSGPR